MLFRKMPESNIDNTQSTSGNVHACICNLGNKRFEIYPETPFPARFTAHPPAQSNQGQFLPSPHFEVPSLDSPSTRVEYSPCQDHHPSLPV